MYTLFKKDLKLFFTDKRAVLLTFLLPLILISLFAFAFGGVGGSSKPIDLLVTDLDNSKSSAEIISQLDSLPGLTIIEAAFDKAKDQVGKGEYAALLIFHQGFEDSINHGRAMPTELMYDEAREMEVGMLQPVLMSGLLSQVGQKAISSNIETYIDENFPDIDDSISQHILEDVNTKNTTPQILTLIHL